MPVYLYIDLGHNIQYVDPLISGIHHEAINMQSQSFQGGTLMGRHSHGFVENYDGLVGFGLNRETDENTVIYYLQKFSDDDLMQLLKNRLKDHELAALFDMLSNLLRKHLTEDEYHRFFLKEEH